MKREFGVCPKCFGGNIEALTGVLRRCRDCGKHFGQPQKPSRVWSRRTAVSRRTVAATG